MLTPLQPSDTAPRCSAPIAANSSRRSLLCGQNAPSAVGGRTLATLARFTLPALLTLLTLLLAGCVHPIGADQTSLRIAYRQAQASAMTGDISAESQRVLHRFDLDDQFGSEPAEALKFLHDKACKDDRRDLVFALAELSYLHASRLEHSVRAGEPGKARDFYLSSAIYSYLCLFGPGREPPPSRFDDRFRLACHLYNAALAKGLGSPERTNAVVVLEEGPRQLPPGRVEVRLNTNAFPFPLAQFDRFLSADQFLVRGLSVRDRQSGLGAPLIAVGKRLAHAPIAQRDPATVFARPRGDLQAWNAGQLSLELELYSGYGSNNVDIAGTLVPLESDLTAPLANSLNQDFIWGLGMGQFFSGIERIKSDIYLTQPYQPGRVPVVFVHGTFSSPVWWAEMINTLRSDPQIRQHCQLWVFIYNSGNPVPFSALKLRECLTEKLKQLDPAGQDSALRQMVVIGHSQGGLLTKLTATQTGEEFQRSLGFTNLDKSRLTDKQRELVRRYTVFEPLPFVKRLIFISTPHRGSYLATGFVRRFVRRFVSLPSALVQQANDFAGLAKHSSVPRPQGIPTSLDSMSPSNKFLLSLAEIPPAPGITCHSIIAVNGAGDYHQGKDGLVAYSSAHVDYAASEFIVRSPHSCQGQPSTIEEVRRILLEHLKKP